MIASRERLRALLHAVVGIGVIGPDRRLVEFITHGIRAEALVMARDDGVGTDGTAERGGLANMRARASRHGGSFHVRAGEPSGTIIEGSAPRRPVTSVIRPPE